MHVSNIRRIKISFFNWVKLNWFYHLTLKFKLNELNNFFVKSELLAEDTFGILTTKTHKN